MITLALFLVMVALGLHPAAMPFGGLKHRPGWLLRVVLTTCVGIPVAALLLLRSPSNCQPALAEALVASTRSYESCYQADGQTLAALLINRNAKEATLRRNTLLASLPSPFQARFVTLAPALSLDTQLAALERQEKPVVVLEENK